MARLLTHGPVASWTVEVDLEGNHFAIGPQGQIVTGTMAGAIFTKAVAAGPNPIGLGPRLQRELDILAGLGGYVNMARELDNPWVCLSKAGSTTSAIKIHEPVLPNDATIGGTVEIEDRIDGLARPPYAYSTITGGDTVNLTTPMSEAAPLTGVRVNVYPKRKPRPNPAHWTLPAIGFQIGSQWFVIQATPRSIGRATLNAGTNQLDDSGFTGVACDLVHGAITVGASTIVTNKPRGTWDSGAVNAADTVAAVVKARRGTTAEIEAYTTKVGEILVDTVKNTAVVGDGTTGGEPLAFEPQFSSTEHWTGAYRGTDKVYEKSFTFSPSPPPGNSIQTVLHDIDGLILTRLVDIQGDITFGAFNTKISGSSFFAGIGASFVFGCDLTNLIVFVDGWQSSYPSFDVRARMTYCR